MHAWSWILLFTSFATSSSDSRAPSFTLQDVRGKSYSLDDIKSTVVVLNFWAFWCDTWKDELPRLKELSGLQDDDDFTLIAIAVDGKRLEQFMERTGGGETPFPVLIDERGRISFAYRIVHVPTIVILDRERRVRYCQKGVPRLPQLLKEIRRIRTSNE